MPSTETAIHWFEQRRQIVGYSSGNRFGDDSYDSSSAVYYALIAGGLLDVKTKIGNVDSLFDDLTDSWYVTESDTRRRGDVVLLGRKGSASGDAGLSAIFTDENNIIHCSKNSSTIVVEPYQTVLNRLYNPPSTFYRNTNSDSDSPTTMTNIGELESLTVLASEIIATGWHFSSFRPVEYIEFVNAVTNTLIERKQVTLTNRPDIAEKYPDVSGIGLSGFTASITVPNDTALYVRAVRSTSTDPIVEDVLVFDKILIYEQAFDHDPDYYALTNEPFFYEIVRNGSIIHRDNKILGTLNWTVELMTIPTCNITLPLCKREYINGRDEIKLYINNKVFHGIIIDINYNLDDQIMDLNISHIVSEWQYRQISTNTAVKNRDINDIYSTLDFRYVGWNMNYYQDSANYKIDYVYSRQDKLSALTKTCELTPDLFWRVSLDYGRELDIGSFGELLPYSISFLPTTGRNIQILGDLTIQNKLDHVINVATVYGEKSDSGMSSMSLREVYEEPSSQDPQFPVIILKQGINNERNYDYIEFSKLAPNNDIEYSVIDLQSVSLENDIVIEGTFSFNDLSPFNDGDSVTDEDRSVACFTAYQSTVKKLIQSRRRTIISLNTTTRLSSQIKVGNRIRLFVDLKQFKLEECSNYEKEILFEDDIFYITSISYQFDNEGNEYNSIRLEKFLQLDRESEIS
jgi:hypothetical protein